MMRRLGVSFERDEGQICALRGREVSFVPDHPP